MDIDNQMTLPGAHLPLGIEAKDLDGQVDVSSDNQLRKIMNRKNPMKLVDYSLISRCIKVCMVNEAKGPSNLFHCSRAGASIMRKETMARSVK